MFRSFVYRASRRAYTWARRDVPNSPESNGEYWLLSKLFDTNSAKEFVLFDIGANKGDWTAKAIELSIHKKTGLSINTFEPSTYTHDELSRRFRGNTSVSLQKIAFSDVPGTAVFYESSDGAGSNSLLSDFGDPKSTVTLQTLDGFLTQMGIKHVDLIKVDVEGFDAKVISGGRDSLTSGIIDLLQFEYNWRWALTGSTLRLVFDLIKDKPYRFGKLAGNQLLLFEAWHMEMERFFENNYVLVKIGSPLEKLGTPAHYDSRNVLIF